MHGSDALRSTEPVQTYTSKFRSHTRTMPPAKKSSHGQSIVSSRRSKGSRALADVTTSALNRRGSDCGKHGTMKRRRKNEESDEQSDDEAAIIEIGRRITRSMTLATSTTLTSTVKPSSRKARMAPPDPSTMRTTRSMTLRDKRLTAGKISIDAIANVATYLEPNNDAMNICLAVGPEGAQIIRSRFLRHDNCDQDSQSSTIFLYRIFSDGVPPSRRRQMVYQWMLVNNKWRSWLQHGSAYRFSPSLVARDETSSIFSLVPILANPGLATALCLTFVVELHFQRRDFDVNGLYNYEFRTSDANVGREENRAHLITIAMSSDDVKTFNVLLEHPRIELSAPQKTFDETRRLLLFFALLKKSNSPYFFRKIATHRKFNVNEPLRFNEELIFTPLLWLISRYYNSELFHSSPRWALEILIEAGGDVHLEIENMRSPYNAALAFIEDRPEAYNDDETARFLEALTVMQEWPASMKINGLVRGFLSRRRLAAARRYEQPRILS